MPVTLTARPLTAAAFTPFGGVSDAAHLPGKSIAGGRTHIHDSAIDFSGAARADGVPAIDIYRIAASSLPLDIRRLERHPASFQTFIPMTAAAYLVVVCPDDRQGQPVAGEAMAFTATGGQIVTYAEGVWHAGMTVLEADGDLAMLMWKRGQGDTEFCDLADAIHVGAPS